MNFFDELSDKCDDIRNQHPYCGLILVGDFNAHHREWLNYRDTNCAGRQAKWFATWHDLTQIVSDSTFESKFYKSSYSGSMPDNNPSIHGSPCRGWNWKFGPQPDNY